ncbi:hypothetical protein YC2023_007335 [Brassica napus]
MDMEPLVTVCQRRKRTWRKAVAAMVTSSIVIYVWICPKSRFSPVVAIFDSVFTWGNDDDLLRSKTLIVLSSQERERFFKELSYGDPNLSQSPVVAIKGKIEIALG